jgi:hypothetical protein
MKTYQFIKEIDSSLQMGILQFNISNPNTRRMASKWIPNMHCDEVKHGIKITCIEVIAAVIPFFSKFYTVLIVHACSQMP